MKKNKLTTIIIALVVLGGMMISCCSSKNKSVDVATESKPSFTPVSVTTPTTITFPSKDGILITADLYMAYPETAPLILLCHRANWSRGEYLEIAPKLNLKGFNAIAIDQRSGKTKNNIDNATTAAAKAAGKPTSFVDAEQDIQAAIDYVKANYAKGTFILWGSSYSSSLSLVLAKSNSDKIDAVMAFSPGEYFSDQGKASDWIATEAAGINMPVFISSKNSESVDVNPIYNVIPSTNKTYYLPSSESKHGSEALYESNEVSVWTWMAVDKFLAPLATKR